MLTAIGITLLNLLWLLLNLVGLPGNWLMLATAVAATWWLGLPINRWTLIAVFAIAVIGEIIEFIAGAAGSRKYGGTWKGSLGALAGGIAGAVVGTVVLPLPVIGTLAGAAVGAFIGATAVEISLGRPRAEAIRAGQGAALGRIMGTVVKFSLGIVMWLALTADTFIN